MDPSYLGPRRRLQIPCPLTVIVPPAHPPSTVYYTYRPFGNQRHYTYRPQSFQFFPRTISNRNAPAAALG